MASKDVNNMKDKFAEVGYSFAEPVFKTNKTAVAQVEKLVSFQMSTLSSYVDFTVERMKAAADVTSTDEFQSFMNDQMEAAAYLRKKMLDDAKALTEIMVGFRDDYAKLAEENVHDVTEKAGSYSKEMADTVAKETKKATDKTAAEAKKAADKAA